MASRATPNERPSPAAGSMSAADMHLPELLSIVAAGEGPRVELKRSTAELRRGVQTVCAFLNGKGGRVVLGVAPHGEILGQQVSDKTVREVAQELAAIDPPAKVAVHRIGVGAGKEVLVLDAEGGSDLVPFTCDGRPYERVASTTRRMPRERFDELVIERMHATRRWENQGAEGTTIRNIDAREVRRVLDLARDAGRLEGPVGRHTETALERLGVMQDGRILRAAVVLFGKRFLPNFPQCELRLARFRGTDKESFIDESQMRGGAVHLLDEAMVFAQRHLPVAKEIVEGRLSRVETPLIPWFALREILVNALIHRDYSLAGGSVALAIFDDRVEVWSTGVLPTKVTAASLSRKHGSHPRNPFIADVFYRAGLIEKWGRGTNRVIEMCRRHGIAAPTFEEIAGSVLVTFRVKVGTTLVIDERTPHVTAHETAQVTAQVAAVLEAAKLPSARDALQRAAGLGHREHFRKAYLEPLLRAGWLEMTIPDKPRSRLQRYRTTEAGLRALAEPRA